VVQEDRLSDRRMIGTHPQRLPSVSVTPVRRPQGAEVLALSDLSIMSVVNVGGVRVLVVHRLMAMGV